MPTITPQGRPTIGGSDDSIPQRTTVKVSTGINPSPKTAPQPQAAPPKTGQSSVGEETRPPAVTLSPQLSALARKQQKLQAEIQAQREKEAAFEASKADFVPKSAFKDKLKQNAAEALAELGTNYDELSQLMLAQAQGADPNAERIERLTSEVENLKKSQEENVNKQFEATLKQYKAETDALVASDPKAFHFILKENLQDDVVQHIVDTWKDDPDQVLTVAQAAKEVEEVFREKAKAIAEHLKELEPAEAPAAQSQKTLPPPKTAAAPKTLTEQVAASPTQRTYGQFQHLSMKERIAQSIARASR